MTKVRSCRFRAWLAFTTAATSLALGGCATPAPAPVDTGVELPASWNAAEPGATPLEPAVDWWSEFDNPELDALIEEVLTVNNDLAAAAARVEAAAAEARIAGGALKPQLSIGADGSRGRRNFIGLPIPGSEGGVLSTTSTSVGASLNVSWEIDLWGRLRAVRGAAGAGFEAAQADLDGARLSLAGQTAKAWFAALEARLQVELAEETLESRAITRKRIRRRYELGTRGALDLRLAIANEARAAATLSVAQRRLDAAERQLNLLLSKYPTRRTGGAGFAALPEPPVGLPALLPSDLITRRPDLAAFDRRLEAAGFNVEQARAALYPRLSLTGSTGRLSSDVEDLLDSDFSVWSLAANLFQPVFQGGRLRAGIDLAEARQRELAERYAQSVLNALAEVELALVAERLLAEQTAALRTTVEQSVAAQKLAEDRYAAGLVDFLTVLESQRDANQAQIALLAAERQRLDARIDLHLALGGGTPPPPPHTGLVASAPTTSTPVSRPDESPKDEE